MKQAGIAYILQDKSVFLGTTVEENLWMGGYLMNQAAEAKKSAERLFDKCPRLAEWRNHQAKALSGGECRLLEISRALVMNPDILLVDEPSIGLEPRFIDMVFEFLHDLQPVEGNTIVMDEQNEKRPGICRYRLCSGLRRASNCRQGRRSPRQSRCWPSLSGRIDFFRG